MFAKRVLVLCLVVIVSMVAFTACGSSSASSEEQSGTVQTMEQDTAQLQTEATQGTAPGKTPEKEVVAQEIAAPDTKADAADLTGSWVDIHDSTRFVNITQNGEEYTYEDNESKLQATYKDGVLELKISDTETAKVYLDNKTGYLMLVYQDNISEYKKK